MPSLLTQARNNADLPRSFATSIAAAVRHRKAYEEIEKYCMFIGYPRSGHSLVGSLLDAHPDAVISHELDALRYFKAGFRRDQVFALILEKQRRDAETGRWSGQYQYQVPNQWQGRYRRLRVLGDKKGGRSTRRMNQDPKLIDRVARMVKLPMRFVHVTRNPFDNISTMLGKKRERGTLDATIEEYFALCRGVVETHRRFGPEGVIDLRHEDLLADTETFLRTLCGFVDLEAEDDYVKDCASILFASPKRTRDSVDWSDAQVQRVHDGITEFPFLSGYTFES